MEILNQTFNSPEDNIDFDKKLLLDAEQSKTGSVLRLWESNDYVVVLGRGCSLSDDVYVDKCKKDNIEILQRISGGGTVLLGKGCLNYSMVLPYGQIPDFKNIQTSFKFIIDRMISSFKNKGITLTYYPVSDIAVCGKKVSGNAQARKKRFFLQHGTFLYDFDIAKISYYLKEPKKMPEYRGNKKHSDFLTNINLQKNDIEEIIKNVFTDICFLMDKNEL